MCYHNYKWVSLKHVHLLYLQPNASNYLQLLKVGLFFGVGGGGIDVNFLAKDVGVFII